MPYTPRPEIIDVDLTPRPLPSLATATCQDAFGWWLDCRCTTGPNCHGGGTQYAVRRLIERYRCGPRRLLDMAARLRCKRCGAKPTGLALIEDVQRVPKPGMRLPGGAPPSTVVDLLPLLVAQGRGASIAVPVTWGRWLVPVTSRDLERNPALGQQMQDAFGLDGLPRA